MASTRQAGATMTTRNVNYDRGKGGTRVPVEKYEIMKKAILKAVPRAQRGIAFKALPKAVALGTWQQIVHLECDTRARARTVVLTVIGE